MQFPERFSALPEYAFPRLRRLLDGIPPGGPEIAMSIGEPRHPLPPIVAETIAAHAHEFGLYPPNDGTPDLLEAIAGWLARRYGVTLDPAHEIIALNGTREGLFNAGIALSPERKNGGRPAVLMPNPFYQAYGAAALAARRRAGAGSGHRRDRLPARLRRPARRPARPGQPLLPLLALEPAGRGGERGLPCAA